MYGVRNMGNHNTIAHTFYMYGVRNMGNHNTIAQGMVSVTWGIVTPLLMYGVSDMGNCNTIAHVWCQEYGEP